MLKEVDITSLLCYSSLCQPHLDVSVTSFGPAKPSEEIDVENAGFTKVQRFALSCLKAAQEVRAWELTFEHHHQRK
jgi:hypothetical protein